MVERSVWTVRTGKFGERDNWALENNLVGGGWKDIPDLTQISTRDEMEVVVRQAYGAENPGAIPVYVGQLWALRSRIKVDDLLVLPLKTTSQIAFGKVTGSYEYLANEPDPLRRHVLRVQWLRTDVPRTSIKDDLRSILGSALTIFQPKRNDAVRRLFQVAESGEDPGSQPSPLPMPSDFDSSEVGEFVDLEEYSTDRILTLIQENFGGHNLTRLVKSVLEAEGFICEMKPAGSDGGVDIIAGMGPLGLDAPRLVVQVKSESSAVGDPVVQTLQGAIQRFGADQALLVAWGGVNKNAAKFLETTKFSIRVWESQDLIDSVFKHYHDLSEEIKSSLPLKRIWIPVASSD